MTRRLQTALASTLLVFGLGVPPTAAQTPLRFSAVSAGSQHSCALTTDGRAWCWGDNNFGQLGTGDSISSSAPMPVVGGHTFTAISAGSGHTCGLTREGKAWCWGVNRSGNLGDFSNVNALLPVPVVGNLTFTTIDAGVSVSCGLSPAGAAFCWGAGGAGRLGDGSQADRNVPGPVSGGLAFQSLTLGNATCGLTRNGAAHCWGFNANGAIGDSTTQNRFTPVAVKTALTFAALSAGGSQTCAVTAAGDPYCWGGAPRAVSGGPKFMSVGASSFHACGLTATGAAFCWGSNRLGRLGDGKQPSDTSLIPDLTSPDTSGRTPVPVLGGLVFSSLSLGGESHTCGVTRQSQVYCWGRNHRGQLGDGTTVDRNRPVAVANPARPAPAVSAGESAEIAQHRQKANQGIAESQYLLGKANEDGTALPRDFAQANDWFRKAADKGHAGAQFRLGVAYNRGSGTARSDSLALFWFRKAAEGGEPGAQVALGVRYHTGSQGVAKDPAAALSWYRKAAAQHFPDGIYNVGIIYLNGEGVPVNLEEAQKWVALAVLAEPTRATFRETLRKIQDQRKALAGTLAATEVTRIRTAADQGDKESQYQLGNMFVFGRGVTRDTVQAMSWWRKAAEQGLTSAQLRIAAAFENGSLGLPKDPAQAFAIYRQIANLPEGGHPGVYYAMAMSYAGGVGAPRDDAQAIQWFRRAAEYGHGRSINNLGVFYESGRGVAKDFAEAMRWYRKALDQGTGTGGVNLGRMYSTGIGTTKDEVQATAWYIKAAELGDADGQFFAGLRYADGVGVTADTVEAYKWVSLAVEASAYTPTVAERRNALRVIEARLSPPFLVLAKARASAWKSQYERTKAP